jgi:hypothetical protein
MALKLREDFQLAFDVMHHLGVRKHTDPAWPSTEAIERGYWGEPAGSPEADPECEPEEQMEAA